MTTDLKQQIINSTYWIGNDHSQVNTGSHWRKRHHHKPIYAGALRC